MNYERIFAPHRYFWQVGQLLIAAGLKFLAKVTITSKDTPYHMGAGYARVTSLFFHQPGKALIVKLEFNEKGALEQNYYSRYWLFKFFCEESYTWWLKRLEKNPARASQTGGCNDDGNVPGVWELLEIEGLGGGGGSIGRRLVAPGWEVQRRYWFNQEYRIGQRERMDPQEVVSPIIDAVRRVKPALSDRFCHLSAWGFTPGNDFPGCEPLFWKRFPTRRFRQLADHVVGIKFRLD